MLPEFPMKSFFHAAILSLGLLPGIISTGTAQDFGAMSFGGAGDFGTPQASGTARATVESYAAEPAGPLARLLQKSRLRRHAHGSFHEGNARIPH